MKYLVWALLASLVLLRPIGAAPQQPAPQQPAPAAPPGWAFPVKDPVQPAPPEDPNTPVKVAGSAKSYTRAQVDDLMNPPDWFPDEHPAMPSVVAKGQGDARACDSCHLPNGMGHPESATLAGFTVTYLKRQLEDMKSGARRTGGIMDQIAKAMSDEEMQQSAAYFASLKPFPYIKVVEAAMAPKSYVIQGGMRLPWPSGGEEPLGQRIIVVPEDPERILARDIHGSGTIAYVPPGSIAKGKALVETGGAGKTVSCKACHGETLQGNKLGDVPRIAGLQPIYIFRQMYSIQHWTRTGASVSLMNAPMMNLSGDDMIAIAAYVGSLAP
jgi:cytochrome c553